MQIYNIQIKIVDFLQICSLKNSKTCKIVKKNLTILRVLRFYDLFFVPLYKCPQK